MLFQEFKFEVIVRTDHIIIGLDHLSRVNIGEESIGINDELPDAHLFRVEAVLELLDNTIQFLQEGKPLEGLLEKIKKILEVKSTPYTLISGLLYKLGPDYFLR